MSFIPFSYRTSADFISAMRSVGAELPFSDDVSVLCSPISAGSLRIKNRLVCQPMEGNDGDLTGAPTETGFRRYKRLAAGGAGVIWMESIAVTPESRTGETMYQLTPHTLRKYGELLSEMRAISPGNSPVIIAQLTHCGRFSRLPGCESTAAHENPHFPGDHRILSDQELQKIRDDYIKAACLAEAAGFDAVDIRACHGYLLSELLGGFTRPGLYGGSFGNRIRLILEIIDGVRQMSSIPIVMRLNAYDAVPKPYGFGTDENGAVDLTEPINFVRILYDRGLRLFNISATLGPFCPYLQRPSDDPQESDGTSQFIHMQTMHDLAKGIKAACPNAVVIASAFSWARQFGANIAAGGILSGHYDMAGWGRETYAYPDFPADIMEKGSMDPKKCCVSCSRCITLMANHVPTGCIIRDSQMYMPIFKTLQNTKAQ
mgnify:CR=1 FL=1